MKETDWSTYYGKADSFVYVYECIRRQTEVACYD